MQESPVIEQNRESDTTKYNQKSQNDLQAIQMPDQRIIEIARQRGEPGITESRNTMKQGEKEFIVNSRNILHLHVDEINTNSLDDKRGQNDIHDRPENIAQRCLVQQVFHHELIVKGGPTQK